METHKSYNNRIISVCQVRGLVNTSQKEQEYVKAFGSGLKQLRANVAQKSLRIFSYETDVPCATLSRIENGLRIPNIVILKRLAVGFNLTVDELIKKLEDSIPEKVKNFEE